jgi:hypothetical protein
VITDYLSNSWEAHTGPDIVNGGKIPTHFGTRQYGPMTSFYCEGEPNSGWLAAQHRQILGSSLKMKFSVMFDPDAPGNTAEFDIIIAKDAPAPFVIDGKTYLGHKSNMSCQILGLRTLQLSDVKGNWVGSADVSLQPGISYDFIFEYWFDFKAKLYKTSTVRINGSTRFTNEGYPLAAQPTDWKESCTLQIQQNIGPKGVRISQLMRPGSNGWLEWD